MPPLGMNILGISSLAHDTAAALVIDGQPVAFLEEERLNRDKHTWSFPDLAIGWRLEQAGLKIDEIDVVAFDYRPGLDYARALALRHSSAASEIGSSLGEADLRRPATRL
jgi:carbamoyltransferase